MHVSVKSDISCKVNDSRRCACVLIRYNMSYQPIVIAEVIVPNLSITPSCFITDSETKFFHRDLWGHVQGLSATIRVINSLNYKRAWRADQLCPHKESTQEILGQGFTISSFYSLAAKITSVKHCEEIRKKGGKSIFHAVLKQFKQENQKSICYCIILCWTAPGI